ncbi:hypothetical protein A483_HHAL011916, partial [Halyomorpha halys]
MRLDLSEARVQ